MKFALHFIFLFVAFSEEITEDIDGPDMIYTGEQQFGLRKMLSCALISSGALDTDSKVLKAASTSVHDPDLTYMKLAAQVYSHCLRSISSDFTHIVLRETWQYQENDTQVQNLVWFDEPVFLDKNSDIEVGEEEGMLIMELMEVLNERDNLKEEAGIGQDLEEENIDSKEEL